MTSIYLSHHYLKQDQGRSVQRQLEEIGFTVVNPFDRGEQELYESMIKSGQDFDDDTCHKIVENDLKLIDDCDAMFAIVSPSIGTSMEIFYADCVGKPVVIWVDHHMPYRHPWLVDCSTFVSESLSESLAVAQKLL